MLQATACDATARACNLRLHWLACMTFLSDGWFVRLPWTCEWHELRRNSTNEAARTYMPEKRVKVPD